MQISKKIISITMLLGMAISLNTYSFDNIKKQATKPVLVAAGIASAAGLFFLIKKFFLENNQSYDDSQGSNENSTNIVSSAKINKQSILMSFLGGAVGDAMGRPTEFIYTTEEIFKKYPGGVRGFNDFKRDDFVRKNGKRIAPYTDDTAMSIIVAKVLNKAKLQNWSKEKTMEHIAEGFVEDMDNPNGWTAPGRAPGNCCMKNCKKLKNDKNKKLRQRGTPFASFLRRKYQDCFCYH